VVDALDHDTLASGRVFKAEGPRWFIVSEQLGIAGQRNDATQRAIRLNLSHVILELILEAKHRRTMAWALVEDTLDLRRQRHMRDDVLGEQRLALVDTSLNEAAPRLGKTDIAFKKFCSADLQD
jgi:hypothetical protein